MISKLLRSYRQETNGNILITVYDHLNNAQVSVGIVIEDLIYMK